MNWLDILTGVLGVLFLGLSALCVVATISVISTWGDPEPTFPVGESFLQGLRGFSVVFLPVEQIASNTSCPLRRAYTRFSAVETVITKLLSCRSSICFSVEAASDWRLVTCVEAWDIVF